MNVDARLLANIVEVHRVDEERPHRSAPDVRVRVFGCGCQVNDRSGYVTNVWLCQYHDGYADALDEHAAVERQDTP